MPPWPWLGAMCPAPCGTPGGRSNFRLADDHLGRASAAGLMGLASWASGDLEAGHRAYAECMAGLRRAGHIADTFGCAIALADIRRTQGRLGEAMRTYEQALQRASQQGGSVLRGTADMYVGMSEIHRERDDLPAATQQLLRSQELGEHTGLPQNRYRWRVAMARIREAEGDLDGALDLLNEAERLYVGDFFPNVRPVPALRARVRVAQGELGEALGWARERGLSVDGRPQLPARVRAHHPGPGAPGAVHGTSVRSAPSRRRPGSWSASCERRKRGGGRAASSRSWCCRRWPTRREATSPLRLPHCDAR